MLWTLRIALYVQMLLGLGRFAGLVTVERIWETHVSLGVAIALLALVALRPLPGVPNDRVRALGRLAPLAVLLIGLGMYQDWLSGLPVVLAHMVLGLGAVGLVEAAAARQRRAGRGFGGMR